MNAQELGKFVAYKDAVLIVPFTEGRGLPHDFSTNRAEVAFYKGTWIKNGSRFNPIHDINLRFDSDLFTTMLNQTQNEITLEAFIKMTVDANKTATTWREWYNFGDGSFGYAGSAFSLRSSGANYFYVDDGNGNRYDMLGTVLMSGSKKYHIAGIYDAGKIIQLINGVVDFDVTKTNVNIGATDKYAWFGTLPREYYSYFYFIAIYKRALEKSEVKSAYYHAKRNVKPTAVTRRGVYQAVKNTGIEIDGNMTNIAEVMC